MNRRQFSILFLCNFIPWWVGSGLISLLPLYAAGMGASPALVGNYLSLIFLALATGTFVGGWIAPKVRDFRQLLMGLAAICAGAVTLFGQADTIWQLMLLSMSAWFCSGITIALVMILVGEQTEEGRRGQAFGLLATAASLGGVLGGISGFVVDHWGYSWLFALSGATWLAQVGVASFLENPSTVVRQVSKAQTDAGDRRNDASTFTATFVLQLAAALLFSVAGFAGFLGRTLAMAEQGFPSATITVLTALGSGLGLVVTPLLGRLSDRGGRRWLLAGLYLLGAFALLMTVHSRTVTDFVVVAILLSISSAERGISVALLSDTLSGNALSRGLSLFDSVKWLGGVIGLAGTGYAISDMGLSSTLLVSALLPVTATLLLLFLRVRKVSTRQVAAPQLDPA